MKSSSVKEKKSWEHVNNLIIYYPMVKFAYFNIFIIKYSVKSILSKYLGSFFLTLKLLSEFITFERI